MAKKRCPYYNKDVKTETVSWLWIGAYFFTGTILIYLLYCLVNESRICTECRRRIYPVEARI